MFDFITDEHEMLRQAAANFAQNEIAPIAAHFDETGEFPLDTVKRICYILSLCRYNCPVDPLKLPEQHTISTAENEDMIRAALHPGSRHHTSRGTSVRCDIGYPAPFGTFLGIFIGITEWCRRHAGCNITPAEKVDLVGCPVVLRRKYRKDAGRAFP